MVQHVDAPVYVADSEILEGITGYDLHRGVLASADRPKLPGLLDVLVKSKRIVVLEGSNDHENIGAIARSARALGFDAMVLDPTCADPYYRRCVRVSMGEILHLPIVRCGLWPEALEIIGRQGFETWALTTSPAANSLFDMGMPDKVALIAGAEGPGLTDAAKARTRFDVRIPMHHGVDSLNLGHALPRLRWPRCRHPSTADRRRSGGLAKPVGNALRGEACHPTSRRRGYEMLRQAGHFVPASAQVTGPGRVH